MFKAPISKPPLASFFFFLILPLQIISPPRKSTTEAIAASIPFSLDLRYL